MKLDEYQAKAETTDLEKDTRGEVMRRHNMMTPGFIDKVLGLSGEAGEAADKVKKIIRDKSGDFTDADREEIAKELGDVLWYVANTALYLDYPLSEIAKMNVEKLASRQKRGVLKGSGDER